MTPPLNTQGFKIKQKPYFLTKLFTISLFVLGLITLKTIAGEFSVGKSTPGGYSSNSTHLSLAAKVENEKLIIELSNTGLSLEVLSHIQTHEKHYDQIRLLAIDSEGKTSWLHFYSQRRKSVPVYQTLKQGETLRTTIDLKSWNERKINAKSRLRSGESYTLICFYDHKHYKTKEGLNIEFKGNSDAIKYQMP